jgi:hypothetical protein
MRRQAAYRQHKRLVAAAVISNMLLLGSFIWFLGTRPSLLNVSVHHVSVTTTGVSVFQPQPGDEFVIVDVTVTQYTRNSQWLAPVTQSYVVDSHGTHYQMAPYALDNPFYAGVYDVGQQASGQLSYGVARSARFLKWCYELSGTTKCVPLRTT